MLFGRRQETSLEERVEKLEREVEALDLEWSEMYDRFKRLLAGMAKRAERMEKAASGPVAAENKDPVQLPLPTEDRVSRLNREIREQRRSNAVPQGAREG